MLSGSGIKAMEPAASFGGVDQTLVNYTRAYGVAEQILAPGKRLGLGGSLRLACRPYHGRVGISLAFSRLGLQFAADISLASRVDAEQAAVALFACVLSSRNVDAAIVRDRRGDDVISFVVASPVTEFCVLAV